MAVGVAHDLNNVLSLMLVAFHQFQRKELDPDSQRWMKVLSINAEHAGQLITQLLLFGKGIDEERVSIKPKRLIKETVGMLKTVFPKSIEIKTSIASKLWSIVGRATQLRQVLMNLCLNAIDAMPGGGTLTIEATNVELMQGYTSALFEVNPGKYVLIKFTDSGIGIPGEIIDKVFEPFFTTKEEKGLGLGLAAVLRIVKSDGGFIRVLSEPGLGTEFCVYLPSGI
jgi:signal transduction histidine kinase